MLKIYNTLSGKKEPFRPREGKKVKLFVCGPTVYDHSHIGHARTYVIFDVIVKYLREKEGYDVFYLQNITDIDDKIINRAAERGITPSKLTKDFEKEYLKDMKTLKVDSVNKYVRATEHIKEIISQINRLSEKGFAYRIEDGIYYDISKFKGYGKLSRRTALQAEDSTSRVDDSKEKKNKGDFCLWKFNRAGEPSWPSPWGKGRPGWHIEDTAITEKYFGSQYDIHGGARDLIFPHHEAEIAQMEAISGKSPLVKYWLHSGFLTVDNQKMSKSLGNFITIKDFIKNNPPRLLRLLMAKTHYRSPINYNEKTILQCRKELEKIDEFINKIQNVKDNKLKELKLFSISAYISLFEASMEDDFNTPKAVAVLFDLLNKGNILISQNKLSPTDSKNIFEFLKKVDKIFGFIFKKESREKTPKEIIGLARERENYRKEKNWQKADETRKEIERKGFRMEDTKEGTKIKKG